MKGCYGVVLVALLVLSVYNWWQVRTLREEMADIRVKVEQQQQQAGGLTQQLTDQAAGALEQARAALRGANLQDARASLATAQRKAADLARAAGERAAPTVRWLERQAAQVQRELDARAPAGR